MFQHLGNSNKCNSCDCSLWELLFVVYEYLCTPTEGNHVTSGQMGQVLDCSHHYHTKGTSQVQRVLPLSSHQYQSPNWGIWGYLSILSLVLLLGYCTGVTSICYVTVNCNCFSKAGKLLVIIYCAITGFLSHSYSSDSKSHWVMNDCISMTLFTMFAIDIQEYILVWFISLSVTPWKQRSRIPDAPVQQTDYIVILVTCILFPTNSRENGDQIETVMINEN